LDALDGSQSLLEVARSKSIYSNFFYELIESNKNTSLPEGAYDIVATCGSFLPGHLPIDSVDEFSRITKSGGHIVIGMRDNWQCAKELQGLEPRLLGLCIEKKWKLVYCEMMANWFDEFEGKVYIFRKN